MPHSARPGVAIDFVIPYVGRPDYLREAVLSVLAQADDACRVLVVEDGPQGHDVRSWLVGLDDDRVEHVENPVRLGVAANFQRCLDLARAEWLVMVGCDDAVRPTYAGVVRAAIEAFPEVDAVLPGVEVMDGEGRSALGLTDRVKARLAPGGARATWRGDALLASLLHGNWSYFPSICWRTETVRHHGFRTDLATTLDLALLADVLLSGGQVATTPEVVFRYRRHASSASSVSARAVSRFVEEGQLFDELRRRCEAEGWTRSARAARYHLTSRLHAGHLAMSAGLDRTTRRALVSHSLSR